MRQATLISYLLTFSQGKGRPEISERLSWTLTVRKKQYILYRMVPCGGVKLCPHYREDCQYVVSTRETKRCSVHLAEDLQRSSPCPVEFVYIKPKEPADNRRWITGIVCDGELTADNFHNHPLHGNVKITSKVDSDIQRAVIENPHLKTQDIVPKSCNDKAVTFSVLVFLMYIHRYWDGLHMPGAASLAATHWGKIKSIRLSTLWDASQNIDQRSCILDFEKTKRLLMTKSRNYSQKVQFIQ